MTTAPRIATTCPKQHSRIRIGDTVLITGGVHKGRVGQARLLVGSIFSVKVGVDTVPIHRTALKRMEQPR